MGVEPGIKDDEDRWDTRPHRNRILVVDELVLSSWAKLVDEPGTPTLEARLLLPVTNASQLALQTMAKASRFGALEFFWTAGWHETADRVSGFFEARSATAADWEDVILQGPHLSVATPFAKQPNPTMRSKADYTPWDLETLGISDIPRTSYQRLGSRSKFLAGYPHWNGLPANSDFRIGWRRMADSSTVRSLHAAILPPGPTHIHGLLTLGGVSKLDLALAAGMWSSIPVDFLVKVSGTSEVNQSVVRRFPHPQDHCLVPEMILRALRLNCLTRVYASLWAELFDAAWVFDAWTRSLAAASIGDISENWISTTPLRGDAERRQALVEIDALAAVMLGLTAEELCAIYRTQFGVLRKYERIMQMDANGRQVSKEVLKEVAAKGARADLGRYELPFSGVNREAEMTIAHTEFARRLAEREA